MSNYYQISIQDFKTLLKSLLKNKIVDKVLTGAGKKDRFGIAPQMITDEKELDNFPLSQLFIWNFDKINSASKYLHKQGGALNEKVAIVGHPCDGRALVELSKRIQVNLENLFIIIMEDIGTITSKDIGKFLKSENIDVADVVDEWLTPEKLYLKLKDNSIKEYDLGDKIDLNENCKRCFRKKLDKNFDIAVTTLSLEPFSNDVIIHSATPKGENVIKQAGIKLNNLSKNDVQNLLNIQDGLMKNAKDLREKQLDEWINTPNRIAEIAKCTMCGMCINSCPVCFCKSCILQKQRKEKSIDKLTYQLTRISHIADACVGCGKCDQNCPPKLPLSLYFQCLNDYISSEIGYVAGLEKGATMPRSKKAVENLSNR